MFASLILLRTFLQLVAHLDDTYSNKSWSVVAQGMFNLREMEEDVQLFRVGTHSSKSDTLNFQDGRQERFSRTKVVILATRRTRLRLCPSALLHSIPRTAIYYIWPSTGVHSKRLFQCQTRTPTKGSWSSDPHMLDTRSPFSLIRLLPYQLLVRTNQIPTCWFCHGSYQWP